LSCELLTDDKKEWHKAYLKLPCDKLLENRNGKFHFVEKSFFGF